MKVLVTGGRGMLGTEVCAAFRQAGCEVTAAGTPELDIADPAQAMDVLTRGRPDLVVHCAAYTDVDGCERDPDTAYRVNAVGAGNVASACEATGSRLIAISTDFVFDGAKTEPYTEYDLPCPLGVYGASKLAGEESIVAACPRHQIVRTSWLFGVNGKCFPKSMIELAKTRTELRVVADQTGSPTYAKDLAGSLVELAAIPLFGTFHLANSGACTWHELAVEAISAAGLRNVTVVPIPSDKWPTATERPKYSVLRPYVWELLGKPPLRHWRDAVREFVAEL